MLPEGSDGLVGGFRAQRGPGWAQRAIKRCSMRVLHLSTYDTYGGAAIAAHRLHAGMCAAGVQSAMWVRRRYGTDDRVMWLNGSFHQVAARMGRRLDRWIARRGGWRGPAPFSPGLIGWSARKMVNAWAPDIVHAHWIVDGFFDVREFSALGRPVVWTFHDMWPITGGCAYAQTCRRYEGTCGLCPLLGAKRENDLSHRMWVRKKAAYAGVPMVGVAPSRWLAGIARRSSLFRERDIRSVPNGVDVRRFAVRDRAADRALLGLPAGRRIILAGASHFRTDARKGFDLFTEVAARLAGFDRVGYAFVVFGGKLAGRFSVDGVEVTELGTVRGEDELASVYAAADLFVAPSREDNFPNTLLESFACGTPAAGFAIGGIPEIIEDGVEGCVARPFNAAELAAKIHGLCSDSRALAEARSAARRKAEKSWSVEASVGAYLALYDELLSRP